MFSLADKVVWVTGAGRGLGRSIALGLAEAGASLMLTARSRSELDGVAKEVADLTEPLVLPADVSDSVAVAEVVATAGRLDALVNCAGISPTFVRSEQVSDADWRRVLDVNLTGTFFCCREFGRVAGEGASVVNIGSVHGSVGFERIAAYAASKGGIEALTKTLAVEWAPRGIRVNALAPGYFPTDLSEGLLNSRRGNEIRANIPLGRFGDGADVAAGVVYLLSDAARYVTGTTLFVDGGWTAR